MDTTPDETDSVVRQLSPSKRTLALVVMVACLLATPVAAQTVTVFDDFEDGDASEWSSSGTSITAESGDTPDGSFFGNYTSGGSSLDVTDDNYDYLTFWFRGEGQSGDFSAVLGSDSASAGGVSLFVENGQDVTYNGGSGTVDTGIDVDPDTWYYFESDITWADHTYNLTIYNRDGTVHGTANNLDFNNDIASIQLIELDGSDAFDIDYVSSDASLLVETFKITGQVTDQDRNEIRDGIVSTTDGNGNRVESELNDTGHYELSGLEDGTFTVETEVPGYQNKSETVTISGDNVTQNFRLVSLSQALELDVRHFMEHGTTTPYSVTATYIDNGTRVREEVTDEANVSSGDTNVVTVDETATELVATDDNSINNRTYVNATWTDPDGEELTTRENVTVANKTVANLDILPPVTRFAASIEDMTLQTILIATGVGAAAAVLAGVFAGISALTVIVCMGWLMGVVPDGIVIVTVLTAMFIGMNVAGNVDYQVSR